MHAKLLYNDDLVLNNESLKKKCKKRCFKNVRVQYRRKVYSTLIKQTLWWVVKQDKGKKADNGLCVCVNSAPRSICFFDYESFI